MSSKDEERIRGNIRFFCDKQIPWCDKWDEPHDLQDSFVVDWNKQLVAAGLKPEPPTNPHAKQADASRKG